MPSPPPDLNSAGGRGELPGGMDALVVGQSIFGDIAVPTTPVVAGYSSLLFIAQGGLGHVWRARRDADGAAVALKVPHHSEPSTAERLVAEAQTLRSLDHPHIVRFFDLTEDDDGAPVIVMELVDGPSLTSQLPNTGFDFEHALQILLPVLDAVAHAHSRGVVHRDLKPSNILIAADGTPKVSDFGLAQSLKDRRLAFSLTRSGIVAGTVEYLAPECYEPEAKATAAADIFALGVILYECLAGRPPRGAWRPLSELKRLDVRLDELVADAIHPVPAERLASAQEFRRRVEEIRDSRPRYAGTPLVTRSTRLTDCLWTLTGLYCLTAGFCTLQAINSTEVPGIFDLRFGHTNLLGGYWALWVLTLLMGVVWGWQSMRLWIFRGVPFREALPSPFGLRFGTSRGAASLVALAQMLCAWGPLMYMAWIHSQVWYWVGPETAPWERVLAVTRAGELTPVSPWTWEPAGMFTSDEFRIREMRPGYIDETWHMLDRQGFFVVTQPLVMLLSAATIVFGLATTATVAAFSWWRKKPVAVLLFFVAIGGTGIWLWKTLLEERNDREKLKANPTGMLVWRTNEMRLRQWVPFAWQLFDVTYREPKQAFDPPTEWFAPQIIIGPTTTITREEFLEKWTVDRRRAERERTVVSAVQDCQHDGPPDSVQRQFFFEAYSELSDARMAGSFLSVLIEGHWRDHQEPPFVVTKWTTERQPLYSAEDANLTHSQAQGWLDSLLRCLIASRCPGLEGFLLPIVLSPMFGQEKRPISEVEFPIPGDQIVAQLRSSRAAWRELLLSSAAPPGVRRLVGGRWELDCQLRQSGTRLSGREESGRPLRWQIEIVFTGGAWRILRLRM